jgi:hypothetical protein
MNDRPIHHNVMQQLADGFARERETLEGQWSRGEDVSTEVLRVALQRYRSFFQRLLSAERKRASGAVWAAGPR